MKNTYGLPLKSMTSSLYLQKQKAADAASAAQKHLGKRGIGDVPDNAQVAESLNGGARKMQNVG